MEGGSQQDLEVLLALKEEEVASLRQQMALLTTDLKRNLEVLRSKDEDNHQLREAVDTLRNVVAEKDALFLQFQGQVAEMEDARAKEAERVTALEQQLAAQEVEWQRQQANHATDRAAEAEALQAKLQEAEVKWSATLRVARQEALEEHLARSQHQQSQLEWAAQQATTLLQEGQNLAGVLAEKEAELETANQQLQRSVESLARMEDSHKQTLAAKDAHIGELKERLAMVLASGDEANADHESQITKLVVSMTQMKEAYSSQSSEVHQLVAEQKRLVEDRRLLREQLKDTEAALLKAQTEKGVLEGALQHEITAQASQHAELNIFKAKLTEAVVDLEQRCAAAESRAGQLMGQLVEERGRLVDAVIEQASSASPALAAELTRSLEADRARTQAELQRAKERATSLQEDLALIRSTLLPLLDPHQGPAAGSSLAALTAIQQQQRMQLAAAAAQHQQLAAAAAGYPEQQLEEEEEGDVWRAQQAAQRTPSPPRRAPGVPAACGPGGALLAGGGAAAPGSPAPQLYSVRPGSAYLGSGGGAAAAQACLSSPGGVPVPAAAGRLHAGAASPAPRPAAGCHHPQQGLASSPAGAGSPSARGARGHHLQASPNRGSTLSSLVGQLQSDVDKLQQQLNHSREQLHMEGLPAAALANAGARRIGNARTSGTRPDTADTQHSAHSSHSASTPNSRHGGSHQAAANARSPGGGSDDKGGMADALQYLMARAEQLSAENGALKAKLEGAEGAGRGRGEGSPTGKEARQGRRRAAARDGGEQLPPRGGGSGRGRLERPGGDRSSDDSEREVCTGSSAATSECGAGLEEAGARGRGSRRPVALNNRGPPAASSRAAAAAAALDAAGATKAAASSIAAAAALIREGSSEGEVLDRILASWPSTSKLSAAVRDLMAKPSSSGGLAGARGGGGGGGVAPSLKHATLSAKAQLRRLAAMSPLRQRLQDRLL